MQSLVLDTEPVEPGQRSERPSDVISPAVSPRERVSDQDAVRGGRQRWIALEDIHVFPISLPTLAARRPPPLGHRTDPGLCLVVAPAAGSARIEAVQGSGRHLVGPGELYLVDSSRPYALASRDPERRVVGLCAEIPRSRLAPAGAAPPERLVARAVAATSGFGSLLRQFLEHIDRHHASYRSGDAARLARTVTELVAGLIAQASDTTAEPGPATADRLLMRAIHAYIEQNLRDHGLTAADIAHRHHISVRHLQRLFQRRHTTPTAHIRRRRLEGAHRELVDPLCRELPVHVVADRWGFTSHAHFTRVYAQHYGRTPTETRTGLVDRSRRKP